MFSLHPWLKNAFWSILFTLKQAWRQCSACQHTAVLCSIEMLCAFTQSTDISCLLSPSSYMYAFPHIRLQLCQGTPDWFCKSVRDKPPSDLMHSPYVVRSSRREHERGHVGHGRHWACWACLVVCLSSCSSQALLTDTFHLLVVDASNQEKRQSASLGLWFNQSIWQCWWVASGEDWEIIWQVFDKIILR